MLSEKKPVGLPELGEHVKGAGTCLLGSFRQVLNVSRS